jgi:tRNA dimethylallyltransferase
VTTPQIPPEIRAEWRQRAAEGHDLHAELARRDPPRAAQLAPADTPRLLRAIELHAATGKRYSAWMAENPGAPLLAGGEWRGLFINPDRDWLKARINRRFEAMLAEGALEEMRRLLAHQPPLAANLGVMKAHGAPHLAAYLRSEMTLAEAIARGQQDTRAYARRQVIFARKFLAGESWRWLGDADEL